MDADRVTDRARARPGQLWRARHSGWLVMTVSQMKHRGFTPGCTDEDEWLCHVVFAPRSSTFYATGDMLSWFIPGSVWELVTDAYA